MPIIYSYPSKTSPTSGDLLLISDVSASNQTKKITIGDIQTTLSLVDGSGTANTIPKWSDSNTLTDSPFTIDTSINSLDIPTFIRHIGNTDSQFGFQADNHFRVKTNGQTTIQSISRTDENGSEGQVAGLYFNSSQRLFTRTDGVEVEGSIFMPGYIKHLGDNDSLFGFSGPNNFILDTDSGRKIAAGPTTVTLYSDTSDTATTTSVARFATSTTGVIIYGQTVAAGAASERGGIVRYYNNANNRYVGISGPITTGTNYQIRLPDSVGTAGQVLKLNTPLLGGSTQDLVWGDAGSGVSYEQGSFTPSISTSAGSFTGGFTNNTTYTKIGNVVNVFWDITFTGTGGGGTISFSIPIAADSSPVGGFTPAVNTLKPNSAPNVTHMLLQSSSSVIMQSFSNSDYLIAGTGGSPSITTGQIIRGVLTYKAA